MKPIDQTVFGAPHGNCFAACVASLLEVALDDVPHFCASPETWYEHLAEWLSPRGLYPLSFKLPEGERWAPAGLHVLSGRSPRGDFLHAVVARGFDVVHDPHPSRAGLLTRVDVIVFVPLDPRCG